MKKINLFLFGEDGQATAAVSSATEGGGASADICGEKSGEVSDTAETVDKRDFSREFDELIRGEYKDAFAERTQKIINARFKETKQLEEKLSESEKELDRTRAESEALREARRGDYAENVYRSWVDEADKLSEEYPGFELTKECENEQFLRLLKSGVGLRVAYEVLHRDDSIEKKVEETRQQTIGNIIGRASRPAENGSSSKNTAVASVNVSSWSRAERDEIERRVARGEKIYL